MTERQADDGCQPERSEDREPYTAPALVVIGNLRDLLAGGGTATNDNTDCSPGGSVPC